MEGAEQIVEVEVEQSCKESSPKNSVLPTESEELLETDSDKPREKETLYARKRRLAGEENKEMDKALQMIYGGERPETNLKSQSCVSY
jgi:hypothetical protein